MEQEEKPLLVTHPDWDPDVLYYMIRCPHCGEEDGEECEYPASLKRDGDEARHTCADCGEEFTVKLHCEYSYSTAPLKRAASLPGSGAL